MDEMLQNLRRKAQFNPHDADLLWKYIHHLERSQGVGEEIPLYAVLTDGETVGSPCAFSSGTAVPYNEGDSKAVLYGRYMDDYEVGSGIGSEIVFEGKLYWQASQGPLSSLYPS